MTDERWEGIMRYFERLWADPRRLKELPEKSLLLSLSEDEVTKIFTKKRLEIIRTIKEKRPASISSLAEMVKRDLTAVERDLKILEKLRIVELEKIGRTVTPKVKKDLLILPLIPVKPFTLEDLEEEIARAES
jgi:predicted transcriptional regulator